MNKLKHLWSNLRSSFWFILALSIAQTPHKQIIYLENTRMFVQMNPFGEPQLIQTDRRPLNR